MDHRDSGIVARLSAALVLVLGTAVAGRLAWEILKPALPLLISFVLLLVVYGLVFRRR